MKIAIYPGSFDPVTKGHLDILKNASEIFDKVIIAVAHNGEKKGFLTVEERKEIQDMYKPSYKEIYDRLAEYERRFSNG